MNKPDKRQFCRPSGYMKHLFYSVKIKPAKTNHMNCYSKLTNRIQRSQSINKNLKSFLNQNKMKESNYLLRLTYSLNFKVNNSKIFKDTTMLCNVVGDKNLLKKSFKQ